MKVEAGLGSRAVAEDWCGLTEGTVSEGHAWNALAASLGYLQGFTGWSWMTDIRRGHMW